MKKASFFLFALLVLASLPLQAFEKQISTRAVGNITISSNDMNGWALQTEVEIQGEIELLNIRLNRSEAATPPQFSLSFETPQNDIHHLWFATHNMPSLEPDWGANYTSQLARNMPLYAFINQNNANRLTVACSESFRQVNSLMGIREEGCMIVGKWNFFTQPEAPISAYQTTILFDRRDIFWSEPISQAANWMAQAGGITPCHVPAEAYLPLYSSWYQFHQDVFDKDIEAECALAAQLGMKTIIVDDGWQTDDTNRGYAYCGDWEVSKRRFPDMAAHVANVHKLGMKYMLWYSVPFMGYKSKHYSEFKDKVLFNNEGASAGVLDPRFPEVREYLIGVYEKALREWDLDGFKLDFIDQFNLPGIDPAVKDNYAGRDIKSLPEAVDVLMKQIHARLSAIKPDILIEFRQSYIGQAIRQYGNMFRAADCPGDLQSNRLRTVNLRLTSGTTAVHADMLEWHNDESAEEAARTILAGLFSTVQYSVMLRTLPAKHLDMVRHWITFTQEHANTLIHGSLKPYNPELTFPLIEAESTNERIIAFYQEGLAIAAGQPNKPTLILNAANAKTTIIDLAAQPKRVNYIDTYGNEVKCKEKLTKGLNRVSIPLSGYIKIEY